MLPQALRRSPLSSSRSHSSARRSVGWQQLLRRQRRQLLKRLRAALAPRVSFLLLFRHCCAAPFSVAWQTSTRQTARAPNYH